jgi:hypothetical protein
MPGVTVCTGWHPAGYAQYGKRFLETFYRHWPATIPLVLYTEEMVGAANFSHERTVSERRLRLCSGVMEFLERHKDSAGANGRDKSVMRKSSEIAKGYTYRFDAVKFCKQLFIPEHAAASLPDGEILVWLDADVVTFKDVPESFIPELMDGADLCFLGRGHAHSEIGFWAVRLNDKTRAFLHCLAETYRSDRVFKLDEWHSAFVFDTCRRALRGLKELDLSPAGSGHVWFKSPLCKYTDHLKGDRKLVGRSKERRA